MILLFLLLLLALPSPAWSQGTPADTTAWGRLKAHYTSLVVSGQADAAAAEADSATRECLARGDSLGAADVLEAHGVACLSGGTARLATARQQLERSVSIRDQVARSPVAERANALWRFAVVLLRQDSLDVAFRHLHAATRIVETQSPTDTSLMVLAFSRYGNILSMYPGWNAEGLRVRQRIVDLFASWTAQDPLRLSTARIRLGGSLAHFGEVDSARTQFDLAIRGLEAAFGPEDQRLITALIWISDAWRGALDYDAADVAIQRALSLVEKHFGGSSPEYVLALHSLATLQLDSRQYPEALETLERELAIAESSTPPDTLIIRWTRQIMSKVYAGLGDFATAEKVVRELLGEVSSLDYWALTGGTQDARQLIGVNIRRLPLHDVYEQLGIVLLSAGRYEEGVAATQEALELDNFQGGGSSAGKRAVVASSVDPLDLLSPSFTSLNNFASGLIRLGHLTDAESLMVKYLRAEQTLEHPCLDCEGYAEINLAEVALARGEAEIAARHLQRAAALLPAGDPGRNDVMVFSARQRVQAGDFDGAMDFALQVEQRSLDDVQLAMRRLSERLALAYSRGRGSDGLNIALTLATATGRTTYARRAWDAVIQSRAQVLDEVGARRQRVAEASGESSEFASASQDLAALLVRGSGDIGEARYSELLERAQERRERAERALARSSGSFQALLRRSRIDASMLGQALQDGSALVAFVRYPRQQLQPRASAPGKQPRDEVLWDWHHEVTYAAFVLRAGDTEPTMVDIGRGAEVDSLIAACSRTVRMGAVESSGSLAESSYRTVATRLRQKVWDPVASLLQPGDSLVFIVPAGSLHLVSFAALPAGPEGYLVEHGPLIHYLATERDLVHEAALTPIGHGLLAIGDPDYDARVARGEDLLAGAGSPATGHFRGPLDRCAQFREMRWTPLPATRLECQDAAQQWQQTTGRAGEKARVLVGDRATESALKSGVHGLRILHVATHGFFLGRACDVRDSVAAPLEEPDRLDLAGLVLAGANQRVTARSGDDDGILTAEEVGLLDLRALEWVVLSACGTGLGSVSTSEGVFGLRRGFQIAGARTLIMSLWPVEDQATREWMKGLYEARLERRLDTPSAMRAAMLDVLRERRTAGRSTHPFFWGAFVATGDRR